MRMKDGENPSSSSILSTLHLRLFLRIYSQIASFFKCTLKCLVMSTLARVDEELHTLLTNIQIMYQHMFFLKNQFVILRQQKEYLPKFTMYLKNRFMFFPQININLLCFYSCCLFCCKCCCDLLTFRDLFGPNFLLLEPTRTFFAQFRS